MSRALAAAAALALAGAAWPASALAHGVQGRAETPIPISAFFWVAAAVLAVSFIGLGVGWSKPRLARIAWRPSRSPCSASRCHRRCCWPAEPPSSWRSCSSSPLGASGRPG